MTKKTYILDTNIIIHDPFSFYNFKGNDVVIPATVLEELENFKKRQDRLGKTASAFIKELMYLREKNNTTLDSKIVISEEGEEETTIRIEMNHTSMEKMKDIQNGGVADNRILAVSKNLSEELEEPVILVTMDSLMVAKADALKIEVQQYKHDRFVEKREKIHKGKHEIKVPVEIINDFFRTENKGIEFELIQEYFDKDYFEGDYVQMVSDDSSYAKTSANGKIKRDSGELILAPLLFENARFQKVSAKNNEQRMLFESLMSDDVSIVVVDGESGSGKTLLASSYAVDIVKRQDTKYEGVTFVRPTVGIGKDPGALPGDLDMKLKPYFAPIYDNLLFYYNLTTYPQLEEQMEKDDFVDFQALYFFRGRTLPNRVMVIDESQNLTPFEVKTIVTRAGENTKLIFIGDTGQIDTPYLDSSNNGVTYLIEKLKDEPSVSVLKLDKVIRSKNAELGARKL